MTEWLIVGNYLVFIVVVVVLCTYMIKDGLRMRKERKEIERRMHGL